jgi:hypothetical protein
MMVAQRRKRERDRKTTYRVVINDQLRRKTIKIVVNTFFSFRINRINNKTFSPDFLIFLDGSGKEKESNYSFDFTYKLTNTIILYKYFV